MVRRGKKGRGKGRDNLGGKVEYTTTSALPVSDHLHHRCIPITRRNARAKRHICEVDIQESKQTFTERTWPRSVGGSISQRYERRERVREPIHKYGNEGKEKKNGNGNGNLGRLQRISRAHRFTRRATLPWRRHLPHPLLKSTHKTPEWE